MALRCLFFLSLLLIGKPFSRNWTEKPVNDNVALAEQVALYMTLLEDYEVAAEAYHYLSEEKPDHPDYYNNAAANYLLSTLSRLRAAEISYILPVELAVSNRSRSSRSAPYSEEEMILIREQLQSATAFCEKAIAANPDWHAPLLNLATAQLLTQAFFRRQDLERAFLTALKAHSLAKTPQSKGNALMLQGIIYDKWGYPQERDRLFLEARKLKDEKPAAFSGREQALIDDNIDISRKKASLSDLDQKSEEHFRPGLQETLDGLQLRTLIRELPAFENGFDLPNGIHVAKKSFPNSELIYIRKKGGHYLLQLTAPAYAGTSARGVKVGDPVGRIIGGREKNEANDYYGQAWNQYETTEGGKFLVYRQAKIIFQLDRLQEVTGWTNFAFRRL